MDRELFIQQLVAALQENEELSPGSPSFSASSASSSLAARGTADSGPSIEPENGARAEDDFTGFFVKRNASTTANGEAATLRLAREAYEQLQFDFPQAQEPQLAALADLYKTCAVGNQHHQVAEFPITATLLDAIAYLNQQSPSTAASSSSSSSTQNPAASTRSSEAGGMLAAAVLLLVFRSCLEEPESTTARALLAPLVVERPTPETQEPGQMQTVPNLSDAGQEQQTDEPYVEKFAAQEDPDDLSQVYEGELPARKPLQNVERHQSHRLQTSQASQQQKLRVLAARSFSSSFAAVSVDTWERWHLDDELAIIMRLLVTQQTQGSQTESDNETAQPTPFYGPRGEWSRYLYVLRDRALRFPGASRNALWRLKELVELLHDRDAAGGSKPPTSQPPQHLVYRVLAELAVSREFQQRAAQRAQQGLALAVQELLPLIGKEVQQLAAEAASISSRKPSKTLGEPPKDQENDDSRDGDELSVVLLQLLHFLLFASPNARTTTEKLHESGLLRSLLMLLPPVAGPEDAEHYDRYVAMRWFPALLRLVGECALWHAGFAAYVARVPKLVGLLPTLKEQLVAEELLLALAFHQHEVTLHSAVTTASASEDVWTVFTSHVLFPAHCESFLDAMKQLQDAVFVLDCLQKVLPVMRRPMQTQLQHSLQQIYGRFTRSFEYEGFAAADAARQYQQQQQEVARDDKEGKKAKEDEGRGQAEALQFTTLRNKLRQSVKALLLTLSAGPTAAATGRASSKLD